MGTIALSPAFGRYGIQYRSIRSLLSLQHVKLSGQLLYEICRPLPFLCRMDACQSVDITRL